jgi:hypothetical protein
MKRFCFLTLVICLAYSSNAEGQGFLEQLGNNLGQQARQRIQRELNGSRATQNPGFQEQDKKPKYQNRSLPNESGRGAGGWDQEFQPIDPGFGLPGNGQPRQPNPRPPQNPPFQQGGIYNQPGGTRSSYVEPPRSPVSSSQYTMIRCPASTQGSIRYTLTSNGQNYGFTMSAGQEQHFRMGSEWFISYFDGTKQRLHKLEGGRAYMISRDSTNRWQLYTTN